MQLSCSRAALRDALRVVSGVVDPRNIKEILKDIRIRTVNNQVELSATDLEVGLKYFLTDVQIKKQGGIVVPTDPINGVVSESQDERLQLNTDENKLTVEGASSRFSINGVSEEEFPDIPDFPEEKALEVEGAVLREMIEKTIFAVAMEKQRYALNGVLLVTKEKSSKIEMVATDGRRLALIRRKANNNAPVTASAIIPVKALQQILKMIGDEEIVKISVQERQVLVKTESAVLVAQLVEGRFPPYKEVIPEDADKKAEIAADDLASAVRQAAVLSAKDSRAIRLNAKKDGLIIESSSPDAGAARIQVAAKYTGDEIELRFNPDFLLDGLKVMGEEVVRIEMKDATRATIMKCSDDYLYLVMPITQD